MNAPHDPGSVGAATAQKAQFSEPLKLRGGAELPSFELAYETYGTLNCAFCAVAAPTEPGSWGAFMSL